MMHEPFFFDGETAGGREVELTLEGDALVIRYEEEERRWTWDEVREMRDQADEQEVVFNHGDARESRLIVFDVEMIEAIRARSPNRGHIVVPKGTGRRLLIWSGVAVASVVLIVFVIIPNIANVLTRLVPVEREVALGNTSMAQIERVFLTDSMGSGFCAGQGGVAALETMAERLTREFDSPYDYTIRVFDSEMVNAFAVPGGHIVFFDGLIQDASSPEQVAGVLAHEIAHVENRDSLRLMLRAAGSAGILSLVIGDFAGGALILLVTEQLVNASHSQTAETNADIFATDRLAEAGLPSIPFGDFFDHMYEEFGIKNERVSQLLSYIDTHPDLRGRAESARAANTVTGDFIPVLTEEEWAELRDICSEIAEPAEDDPA